ncbi:hypothetical protein LXL04_014130 [Taraxacum kok-saghyz]
MVQAHINAFQTMMARAREEEQAFRKVLIAWMKQHDPGFSEFYSEWSIQHPTSQFAEATSICSSDISNVSDPTSSFVLDSSGNFPATLGPMTLGEVDLVCSNTPPSSENEDEVTWVVPESELNFHKMPCIQLPPKAASSGLSPATLGPLVLDEVHYEHINKQPPYGDEEAAVVVSDSALKSKTTPSIKLPQFLTPHIRLPPFLPSPLPLMTIFEVQNGNTMRSVQTMAIITSSWIVGAEISSTNGDCHRELEESQIRVQKQVTIPLGRPPPSPPPPPLSRQIPPRIDEMNEGTAQSLTIEYKRNVIVGMLVPSMDVTEEITSLGHCILELKKKTWTKIRELGPLKMDQTPDLIGKVFNSSPSVIKSVMTLHIKVKIKLKPRTIESTTSTVCTSSPLLIDTPLPTFFLSKTTILLAATLAIFSDLVSKTLVCKLVAVEKVTFWAEIKHLMRVISNTIYTKDMFLRVFIISVTAAPRKILFKISTDKHTLDSQPKLCACITPDKTDKTNNKNATVKAWVVAGLGAAGKVCTVIFVEVGTNEENKLVKVVKFSSTVIEPDAFITKQSKEWVCKLIHEWLVLTVKPSLDGLSLCDVSFFATAGISDVVEKGCWWYNGMGGGPTETPSFKSGNDQTPPMGSQYLPGGVCVQEMLKEGQKWNNILEQSKVHYVLPNLSPDLKIGIFYGIVLMAIVAIGMVKSFPDQVHTWLIKWKGGTIGDSMWDDQWSINSQSPKASLEDKTFWMAGVMIGMLMYNIILEGPKG